MARRFSVLLGATVFAALLGTLKIAAGETKEPILVRIAELEIDPGQIDAYESALSDEIATSIRLEPGVLNLYAVAVKGQPTQVRIFEMYADQAAYEAHLQTAHFKKYKTGTLEMVQSLELSEVNPIALGGKVK